MALYMRVKYRSRQKGQSNAVHVECPPLACNSQALKCVGNLSWLEGREARPPVEPLPNSDFGLAWPLQFARSLKLSTERRRVLEGGRVFMYGMYLLYVGYLGTGFHIPSSAF